MDGFCSHLPVILLRELIKWNSLQWNASYKQRHVRYTPSQEGYLNLVYSHLDINETGLIANKYEIILLYGLGSEDILIQRDIKKYTDISVYNHVLKLMQTGNGLGIPYG